MGYCTVMYGSIQLPGQGELIGAPVVCVKGVVEKVDIITAIVDSVQEHHLN